MVCEKCGHISASPLQIAKLPDWEKAVKPATAELLKQKTFTSTTGTLESGKKFLTLFLSVEARQSVVSSLMEAPPTPEEVAGAAFREKIAPVLDTLAENFRILGVLAEPSFMPLAIVNLSKPFAAFAFVTVEDEPFLKTKLSKLNLEGLLQEGAVATLGVYEV